MKDLSGTGKFFFCCALVITFTAIGLMRRGEWLLGVFTLAVAAAEFFLAYTTKKPVVKQVRG